MVISDHVVLNFPVTDGAVKPKSVASISKFVTQAAACTVDAS